MTDETTARDRAAEAMEVAPGVTVAPSRPRREQHEIHVEFAVAGAPLIDDRCVLSTKRPIIPSIAKLTYRRRGDRWTVAATVYGLSERGGLLNDWAKFCSWHRFEEWPEWLHALADQQHPARPGGWPGDDPEGSYL